MSICPYVRPTTKSFSDLSKIQFVGTGQQLIHNGMQYYLIQDQGQGHGGLNSANMHIIKRLRWIMKLQDNI